MPSQGTLYETGVCLSVTLFALLAVTVAENISLSLPPVLEHGPPPHELYNAGKTVNLPCKARPAAATQQQQQQQAPQQQDYTYTWYRNGLKLEEDSLYSYFPQDGGVSLRISTSGDPVDGYFQCKVSNGRSTAMSNVSLLQAAVFDRAHRHERNKTVLEGQPLRLPCDHVISIPPPNIRWVTVGCRRCDDEQPITLDNRISIDSNGTLVFSHVQGADAAGGRVYKCIAFNAIRRKHIGGSYSRIKVTGGPSQNHVPTLLYSTQSPVVALEGSNITLTCFFAGLPTPTVSWTRTQNSDHPKDKNDVISVQNGDVKIENHSHNLQLTNVKAGHAGYYECVGENEAGSSITTRIRLDVEAAPVLLTSPTSVNTTVGSTTMFTCKGAGIPSPWIQWYRNDQSLYSFNWSSRWEISNNSTLLTVHNVTLDDTSTIHCNLSNKHGSIIIGAYLLIHEAPEEEEEDQKNEVGYDTENVIENADLPEVAPEVGPEVLTSTSVSNVIDPIVHEPYQPEDPNIHQSPNSFNSQTRDEGVSHGGSTLYRWIFLPIVGLVLLIVIVIVVAVFAVKCKRRKRTYKVGEREQRLGRTDNKEEYDSDDSGYLDDRPANQLVHHIREEEAPNEFCVLEAVV